MRKTALTLALAVLAGCGDMNVTRNFSAVVPMTGRETVRISAQELVAAMARTGFTRQEILDHGPAIRNALAVQGGAEFRRDGNVAAIFSVMDGSLYVVSQRGGTYVQELSV
ncbi:hypothetical protein DRV85_15055 [Rhodosalinus halophilus]|uniref:Lipoprotein n=1 Tax=Rhodosalinus halophilus TaxID=2259333 RepID=A0A365U5J9_9RHOB|nr:hypothetical protein [Rhodosalinus halophilus]RBI83661.1 hypothetical protein DRV85_15055 [Rhodosalinus halophilus]